MNDDLISVIMPVYNGERYIREALRSVLCETDLALEIIVVDDGSTDRTSNIVSNISVDFPAVRCINGSHSGVSSARNAGLAAVSESAKYITFLDSDDLNPPGRIARQLRLMREHLDCKFVIGLIQFFEVADETAGVPLSGSRTETVRGVQLAAALFSKDLFSRIGGFSEDMRHGEDTDFFLRLLEAQIQYALDDEVAVYYRRHSTNMTNNLAETRRGFMDALRRSLQRRREHGVSVELGDLFKNRGAVEEGFRND